MIIDNTTDDKTQAIFLKAHLRLLNVGLKNSKMSGSVNRCFFIKTYKNICFL